MGIFDWFISREAREAKQKARREEAKKRAADKWEKFNKLASFIQSLPEESEAWKAQEVTKALAAKLAMSEQEIANVLKEGVRYLKQSAEELSAITKEKCPAAAHKKKMHSWMMARLNGFMRIKDDVAKGDINHPIYLTLLKYPGEAELGEMSRLAEEIFAAENI